MTARSAEQCYWMFRYLERAESTARMLSVTYLQSLEDRYFLRKVKHPLLFILDEEMNFSEKYPHQLEEKDFVEAFLVWQDENPSSLFNTIKHLREDARQVREILHINMWKTINDLYLWINEANVKQIYMNNRIEFYRTILEYCQLIKGSFYDFIYRDEYFHLMELGLLMERANQTLLILGELIKNWIGGGSNITNSEKIEYFSYLLGCCASTDNYLKRSDNFEFESIVSFFLQEDRSPFSVLFCLKGALKKIDNILRQGTHLQATDVTEQIEHVINEIQYTSCQGGLQKEIESQNARIIKELENINRLICEEFFHLNYLIKG